MTASMKADDIIALLDLQPHPEGGHYREVFRDETQVSEKDRSASSAIYYLLKKGERSGWHRIDAAEIWHWYAGAPLELQLCKNSHDAAVIHRLGCAFARGERPQIVVPAGMWQSAQTEGDFTLVGCTVAPAFLFSAFELAPFGFRSDAP